MEHISYLYNSLMGTRGPGALPKQPLSGSESSLGLAFTDPVGASGSDFRPALLPLGPEGATHGGSAVKYDQGLIVDGLFGKKHLSRSLESLVRGNGDVPTDGARKSAAREETSLSPAMPVASFYGPAQSSVSGAGARQERSDAKAPNVGEFTTPLNQRIDFSEQVMTRKVPSGESSNKEVTPRSVPDASVSSAGISANPQSHRTSAFTPTCDNHNVYGPSTAISPTPVGWTAEQIQYKNTLDAVSAQAASDKAEWLRRESEIRSEMAAFRSIVATMQSTATSTIQTTVADSGYGFSTRGAMKPSDPTTQIQGSQSPISGGSGVHNAEVQGSQIGKQRIWPLCRGS